GIYARNDGVHLRFSTRAGAARLEGPMARALAILGDDVYGTDEQTLPGVAMAALRRAGVHTLVTIESGTDGALLAILAGHEPAEGEARYLGGSLVQEGPEPGPMPVEGVLAVRLGAQAALGRSRVTVSLVAPGIGFEGREARIHGSVAQRLRRRAVAALHRLRRECRADWRQGRA